MRLTRRVIEPGLAAALADADWAEFCSVCAIRRKRVVVNTVGFDVLDEERFADACGAFLSCGRSHVVHFLAAHPTVAAREVPAYGDLLNSGDLVVADGAPIAALMRRADRRARRLTSTDGFLRLCSEGCATGLRHYFVGGASEAVAGAVRSELRRRYPQIQIAGFEVPPFRPYRAEELTRLAASIRASGAGVVWVGLGAPKQEILAHQLRLQNAAPLLACIGATFDFIAGTKPRAPRWMQALGFEWLFRLWLEPRRLWRRYLIGNPRFIAGVLRDEFGRSLSASDAGSAA